MGENKTVIEEYLAVMATMDDYLEYLGYNGFYTQLDGREDQFINLTKWLNTFYGGGSTKAFDGYKDADVDDLKSISFDYIRVKYEGKRFRNIAYGLKQNHFFGNKAIWESFKENHFASVTPIQDSEDDINFDSEDLTKNLNSRDNKFKDDVKVLLDDNLDAHYTQLRYNKSKDEPVKLLNDGIRALSAINQKSKNFEKADVIDQVDKLNQITTGMLQKKSPKKALRQVFNLLSDIENEIKEDMEDKNKVLEEIKLINMLSFDLKKILGG